MGDKIEKKLKVGQRPAFRKRYEVGAIILIGWQCDKNDLQQKGTLVRILYDALNTVKNPNL